MDLGLNGKRALVCASSQGLGYACAFALAREGARVVINGRDADKLAAARDRIAADTGGTVEAVVADLGDWDEAAWLSAINANMLPALMLIRAVLPGMQARKFGRIVNITSAMVKTPVAPMGLSTAARTALTAACKALAPEVAADNVTINSLLPERFDTERQQQMARLAMAMKNISYEEAREQIAQSIAARRFGRPEELGDACAFVCSAQAGFISGQQLQMDGGSYRGLV